MVCVSVKTLAVKTFRINNKSKHFSDLLKGRTNISVGKGGFKFVIRKPMTRSSQFGCVRMSPELGGNSACHSCANFPVLSSCWIEYFPSSKAVDEISKCMHVNSIFNVSSLRANFTTCLEMFIGS